MQSTGRRFTGKAALVLLVAVFISVSCVGAAWATMTVWETDYSSIQFDWSGTWDKEDYYAYALYLLDIPDWAYLFAVYGLGWDHIWGPLCWGDNGAWDASDKARVVFYYGYNDGYSWAYMLGGKVYLNWYYLPDLDLVNGGWVNQVCTWGRQVAREMTLDLFYDIAGYSESNETLAYYNGPRKLDSEVRWESRPC